MIVLQSKPTVILFVAETALSLRSFGSRKRSSRTQISHGQAKGRFGKVAAIRVANGRILQLA